jgi:hypothetical protein
MQGEIQQEQWQAYLDDFSKRNSGRTADLQGFSFIAISSSNGSCLYSW